MSIPRTQPGSAGDDAAGRGDGRRSRGRALPEHLPEPRWPRRTRAEPGLAVPPARRRAAPRHRGTPSPRKHTPIQAARRETGLFPPCQQEGDGGDAAQGAPQSQPGEPEAAGVIPAGHPEQGRANDWKTSGTASQTPQLLSSSKEKVSGAVG